LHLFWGREPELITYLCKTGFRTDMNNGRTKRI
jgi:hypothetical protein